MNKQAIIDAWATIRKENQTIPDDVLDFMKDSALDALSRPTNEQLIKKHLDRLNTMKENRGQLVDRASDAENECFDSLIAASAEFVRDLKSISKT
jgi:hypothetical protein